MQPDDRDAALLTDIIASAQHALRVAERAGRADEDEDLELALRYLVQTIGEAANNISLSTRERLPDVPWSAIVGMRHRLVHDYVRVDSARVWRTVQHDLPPLIEAIQAYLAKETED